jgi:hypothetical protein
MTTASATATAVIFVWLGMVLAISFLEAPLKFRAPDVTVRIGLGIGRLVFRALNTVEAVLAVVLLVAIIIDTPPARIVTPVVVAVATLAVLLAVVRPRLSRRSDLILAGQDAPHSRSHYAYVALEAIKVIALTTGGILLLAA